MQQPPLPLQCVVLLFGAQLISPVRDTWAFSFDEGAARGANQTDYEGSLRSLGSFDTVQGFWRYWNALTDKYDIDMPPPHFATESLSLRRMLLLVLDLLFCAKTDASSGRSRRDLTFECSRRASHPLGSIPLM